MGFWSDIVDNIASAADKRTEAQKESDRREGDRIGRAIESNAPYLKGAREAMEAIGRGEMDLEQIARERREAREEEERNRGT